MSKFDSIQLLDDSHEYLSVRALGRRPGNQFEDVACYLEERFEVAPEAYVDLELIEFELGLVARELVLENRCLQDAVVNIDNKGFLTGVTGTLPELRPD